MVVKFIPYVFIISKSLETLSPIFYGCLYCSGFQTISWFCFSEGIWQCVFTGHSWGRCGATGNVVGGERPGSCSTSYTAQASPLQWIIESIMSVDWETFSLSKDRRWSVSGSVSWSKVQSPTLVLSESKLNCTVSSFSNIFFKLFLKCIS